jgi:CRISPR-associated protein Cmr1
MQVTTPLFNGGADPDGQAGFQANAEAGVRPASLRGAMRFWFRALAGIITGPDLGLLAGLEREVFGHTEQSSSVRLRIPRQPAVTSPEGDHDFLKERQGYSGRWIVYLLGQGLGDLRRGRVTRPYVSAGQDFDLKLGFGRPNDAAGDAVAALALASLWLACAYGGVGGRVRRGFGGLRIAGAEGWLPAPWNAASICSPGLSHYQHVLPHGRQPDNLQRLWPTGAAGDCVGHLRQLVGPERFAMAQWPEPPPFPVLSRTHTLAGTSGGDPFRTWASALAYAGEQLRRFRASKNYPAARYRPEIKTPEWDDVVHGPGTRFGLGALGLPVVYKDRYMVNADRGANTPLRRASPLWLRPVGGDDQWRLLSFAFCGQFLPGPDSPEVYLRRAGEQPKRLSVSNNDIVLLATQWITKLAADEWFEPGERSPA